MTIEIILFCGALVALAALIVCDLVRRARGAQ